MTRQNMSLEGKPTHLQKLTRILKFEQQGPVVQSVVSLTKSLVNDSLSLLVRLKSSVLIFFAEKMGGAFALQKMAVFFMFNMFEILTSR